MDRSGHRTCERPTGVFVGKKLDFNLDAYALRLYVILLTEAAESAT